MIDIRDHGGSFGGGGAAAKFVKITSGLIAPTPTEVHEIWIKTDVKLKKLAVVKAVPSLTVNGDTCFKAIASEIVANGPANKGLLSIELDTPAVPSDKIKVLETTYFDYYSRMEVVYVNVGGTIKTASAYYWNGAEWVQFSFADSSIILTTYNNSANFNGESVIVNPTTLEITKRVTGKINHIDNPLLSYNKRGVFYTTHIDNKKVRKYDFGLNLVEEYIMPLGSGSPIVSAVDIDNNWFFVGMGNSIKKHRIDDGSVLSAIYFNNDPSNPNWTNRATSIHDDLKLVVSNFVLTNSGHMSVSDSTDFMYRSSKSNLNPYSWVFDRDNVHMWLAGTSGTVHQILKINLLNDTIVQTIVVTAIVLNAGKGAFTMDTDGNLYCSGIAGNHKIIKLDQTGKVLWTHDTGSTSSIYTTLVTDPTGALWAYGAVVNGNLVKIVDGIVVASIPASTLSPTFGSNARITAMIATDVNAKNPLH